MTTPPRARPSEAPARIRVRTRRIRGRGPEPCRRRSAARFRSRVYSCHIPGQCRARQKQKMHHEATKITKKSPIDERRFFVALVRVVPACVAFL